MRLLQVIFGILWGLGYLGNGILFLYIEWSFVRQSFIQVFNPFLQLQVVGVLLTTPLFWVFLAIALVGHYAVTRIEGYLEQRVKKTEIKEARVVSSPPQVSQETQSISSEPSTPNAPTSALPSQPVSNLVNEPETGSVEQQVKLLEWAIQSSQKVRFSYEEQYGYMSNCTVTPINLKTVEQALWLEGYSYRRGATRNFAIKRMRDIKIVPANEPHPEAGTSRDTKLNSINHEPVISTPPQIVEELKPIPPASSEPTYSSPPQASPNPVSEHKRGISQEVRTYAKAILRDGFLSC